MQDVPALPQQNKFTSEFPNELSLIDPEVEVSHDAKTGPFTVEAKKACPFMLGKIIQLALLDTLMTTRLLFFLERRTARSLYRRMKRVGIGLRE
jgi:hypothetical protein